ncbi:glutaredoxin-like protein NrdH [Leuconostocaceae bacterium ESL0958]|nr:glutaredoxin-like protein NrdH [Leuconostocaceae bacterium ESL0958]
MSEITVFTKNNCIQCKMTKQFLDRANLDYQEINIEEQPAYLAQLKEEGFRQTPVVKVSGQAAFAGFQPGELKKLTA